MATGIIHSVISSGSHTRKSQNLFNYCLTGESDSEDEISTHNSTIVYSAASSCACLNCSKDNRHQQHFTNNKFSTSTLKNSYFNCNNNVEFDDNHGIWPVEHKHQPQSQRNRNGKDNTQSASLGQLSAKESPILGRRQSVKSEEAPPAAAYSLRSLAPAYTQRKPVDQIGSGIATQIDLNAVEAAEAAFKVTTVTNMPTARTNMDINRNRNNGYLHNGTVMTPSSEKREHLYKILVIGELGTGKTSFIKRYVHQFFSQNYRATIGVDFALKVLHWDANTIVRLQLWDIAGQERFGNMTRVYYKEAVGAFIVFDVTRSGTFDCVSKWKEDLDSKVQLPDGSPIPCILLANKCDQEKQGIVTQAEKMDEYVRENGFAGWFETSAKENINIDEAARALVNKILINDKLITAADLADGDKFNLSSGGGDASGTEAKNKCSC